MLFDSHAHYDSRSFNADRDELLSAMPEHGVGRILNAGCDLPSSRAAAELANRYDFIWAAVGSHPDDADHVDDRTLDEYRRLAAGERVVAVGEIGLDYHYEDVPRAVQQEAFVRQLELARELKLPVIVHEREAHADAMEIVDAFPDVRGAAAPAAVGDRLPVHGPRTLSGAAMRFDHAGENRRETGGAAGHNGGSGCPRYMGERVGAVWPAGGGAESRVLRGRESGKNAINWGSTGTKALNPRKRGMCGDFC